MKFEPMIEEVFYKIKGCRAMMLLNSCSKPCKFNLKPCKFSIKPCKFSIKPCNHKEEPCKLSM